ncbi:MAG TPA: TonB-dependent receptor [Gemmatimonadales bacterium]|nr:TonB-dependent receptor [Gemmatimonadales bacterium]
MRCLTPLTLLTLLPLLPPLPPPPLHAQSRDLSGRVLAADSTPLRWVTVRLLDLARRDSAVTGADGRFAFAQVPRLPLRLAVRAVGLQPDTVAVPPDADTLTVYVRPVSVRLPPLVVVGVQQDVARARFENSAQSSVTSLAPADVTRTPGLLEPDVVRVVQLLPGSVARNDYAIGYNVRGGEADQNLVQLDGIPIFNPSHLGGLFSTFDANAVARTDFYAGGFPAGYSGRLSSVLDVDIRSGSREATDVRGQVSLLSSKLLVEGPVGGATYLVGARRTYADFVVGAVSSEELPYYFTDLIGKVTVPLGRGSVAVTGYWGRDVFDFRLVDQDATRDAIDLEFDWGNHLAGITWRLPLGRRALLETRAGASAFTSLLGIEPDFARFTNRARLYTAQTTFMPDPDGAHDLRFGLGVESYAMDYAVGSGALETSLFEAHYRPTVWSGYADHQWRAGDRLILRPGFRLERVTGRDRTLFSPRLTARVYLTPATALTATAGRYHQVIHSIRDQELPVTIYEFWIGADRFVPVGRADHLVLGLERWFGDAWQVSLEGYRKWYAGLVTPNRAQELDRFGDEFIPADGWAWGGDLMVRKHAGALRGWIAYGFARAERRAAGTAYPPGHDRRHTLNVVAFLPGPLGADMGIRWGLGSPLPYTGFVGEWDHRQYDALNHVFEDEAREPIGARINDERYPTYSRLDLSLRWQFTKWGVRWEPYLQLVNAYNRRNVFLYFFDYGDAPPTRTGVSQLPLLPTFGVEFSW